MRGEANGGEQRHLHDAEEEEEDEVEEQRQRTQRAARPSSGPQQQRRSALAPAPGAAMRNGGYVGKHRLSAAIARLDQELQSLQVSPSSFSPSPMNLVRHAYCNQEPLHSLCASLCCGCDDARFLKNLSQPAFISKVGVLTGILAELSELESMESASTACQEVISSTEGKPDPLLPITSGPENASWERWFQRVRSSRSNKWWASKGSDFS
ncbi:hypothetical protein ABZP36_023142 [Zizania latifolia]